MQGPRADFRCKKCDQTMENLPVACKRCPVCGAKRGFEMIFTSLNIGSGIAEKVDKQLHLDEHLAKHNAVKEGAENYKKAQETMMDMVQSKGTPSQRAQLKDISSGSMAAKGALGMIDSDMRQISRDRLFPSLKLHKVVPRGF